MTIDNKISKTNTSSRGAWKPDMIVCHCADGSYDGTIAWCKNSSSQVSTHFVVAQDGRVAQLVDIRDAAWTQGLNIDQCAKAQLEAVKQRKVNPNCYCISIEFEGKWVTGHGALTDKQLAAGIELIKHIRAEVMEVYGLDIPVTRNSIVGHYQINPQHRPNCPGQAFQWDALMAGLQSKTQSKPQTGGKCIGNCKACTASTCIKSGRTDEIKPGDWVRIVGDAVYAGQHAGKTIPLSIKDRPHGVSKIEGSNALLGSPGGINSWVPLKYLEAE